MALLHQQNYCHFDKLNDRVVAELVEAGLVSICGIVIPLRSTKKKKFHKEHKGFDYYKD